MYLMSTKKENRGCGYGSVCKYEAYFGTQHSSKKQASGAQLSAEEAETGRILGWLSPGPLIN